MLNVDKILQDIPLHNRSSSQQSLITRKPVPLQNKNDEIEKVVLSRNHPLLIYRALLHLLPVVVSCYTISLSFVTKYWQDLGNPYQNTILNVLQFVAKAHEILINASLGTIVLHRVHYDLIHSGVPLGFLSSGYELSNFGYLFTKEFWGAAVSGRRVAGHKWLPLWLLVTSTILLATAVGPSSAIVMIPKTGWWQMKDPFKPLIRATFIPLGAEQIWPTSLLSFPDITQECLGNQPYEHSECPSAGFPDIMAWAGGYMIEESPANYTILDQASQTLRYMTSSDTGNKSVGWAASSIVGARQAKDLGAFWQYLQNSGVSAIQPGRPKMSYTLRGLPSLKKPLAEVQCQQFVWNDSKAAFPTDLLKIRPVDTHKPWLLTDIGASDWGSWDSTEETVAFDFIDLGDFTNEPVIGGLFVSAGQDDTTLLWPCTVAPYWHPVEAWLDPKVDSAVIQDSPIPLELIVSDLKGKTSNFEPVRLGYDWTNAITLVGAGYNDTEGHCAGLTLPAVTACQLGYYGFGDNTYRLSPFGAPTAGNPGRMPWLLSTILSMHVAEAMSRVNVAYHTVICERDYANHTTPDHLVQLDNRNAGGWIGQPDPTTYDGYMDRAQTTNISHNMEELWEFQRYGYGWGLQNGVLVYLAIGVLFAHAAIALTHIAILLIGGWGICLSWSSMGDLVALAMGSREPMEGSLHNTGAGIGVLKTWGQVVRVRERDRGEEYTKLELLFGRRGQLVNMIEADYGPGPDQVRAGKKYG